MKWKLATYNLNVCSVMKGGWGECRAEGSPEHSSKHKSETLLHNYCLVAWAACFSHPRKSRPPSVSRFPFRFGFICFVNFAPGWQRLPDSPFNRTWKKNHEQAKIHHCIWTICYWPEVTEEDPSYHIVNAFLRTKGRPIFLSMARGLFITKTWKKPWNQASVNFTFAKLKLSTKDSNAFVIKMPNFHSQMHIFSQMDLSKN